MFNLGFRNCMCTSCWAVAVGFMPTEIQAAFPADWRNASFWRGVLSFCSSYMPVWCSLQPWGMSDVVRCIKMWCIHGWILAVMDHWPPSSQLPTVSWRNFYLRCCLYYQHYQWVAAYVPTYSELLIASSRLCMCDQLLISVTVLLTAISTLACCIVYCKMVLTALSSP